MSGTQIRGKPVELPPWWLEALRRLCTDLSTSELAERLTAVARRDPPFHRTQVGDFLRGEVTTYEMMAAFLGVFPDLVPPVFFASSYEEAHRLLQISRQYTTTTPPDPTPRRVDKTNENTGDKALTSTKTRSRQRTVK
jgi:hypothetical protein